MLNTLLVIALFATPAPSANTVQRSLATVNLFVDPLGSDTGPCLGTGTAACATPQGAINKIPKSLRHGAVVTLAPGSYPAFNISGFSSDVGLQQSTAGLIVRGTLTNSTLASGSATGTATAVATGSTVDFGTLTNSSATFTTNDLQGRFLVITAGTGVGQVRAIVSNTATTITIAGTWTSTVPTAGSTYAIQDAASSITTCGVSPPPPGQGPAAANVAVRISGNTPGTAIALRNLAVTAPCTFGVYQVDGALLIATRLQFSTTAGTASRISYAGPLHVDSIVSRYSGTTGTHITGGGVLAFSTSPAQSGEIINPAGLTANGGTIQNSVFINGLTGLNLFNFRGNFFGLSVTNVQGTGVALATATNFQGVQVSCTGAASATGVLVQSFAGSFSGGQVSPDHLIITGCNTALSVDGPTSFVNTLNAVTATGGVNGVKVSNGALVTVNSSNSFTVSGSEVLLDSSVTGTISGITSQTCLTGIAGWGSRVCKL